MTYAQALDYLHAVQRFGSKPGLSRVNALLDELGHPELSLRFVHVAGTNGKGSTSAMIDSILRAAGLKTGLFVSPFVENFRERAQVGGDMLSEEEWALRISHIRETSEAVAASRNIQATEFELLTALALKCFADHACDMAILEVGLGGRFDATNCIPPPEAAVITALSLDHTEYLGSTLADIAFEKCGIIKPGCPVVTCAGQPAEAMEVIVRRCREEGAELRQPDAGSLSDTALRIDGSSFRYRGRRYSLPLAGAHQVHNAMTAIETALTLRERGFDFQDSHIETGLATTRWGGRLEAVRRHPLCLIDGAHNPAKIAALCRAIDELLPHTRIITVMGMSGDKDCAACVAPVASRSAVFLASQYEGLRALAADRLAQLAGAHPHVEVIPTLSDACQRALALAGPEDVVLACGSLYLIGDAKRAFVQHEGGEHHGQI